MNNLAWNVKRRKDKLQGKEGKLTRGWKKRTERRTNLGSADIKAVMGKGEGETKARKT